ncbi:hypothetical protein C8A01DRAFT_19487 [Parachaetomium inaequale]|uniref:Uncharacterized protein n=1 Tax=Parachaetomium inaequale TaxID=2588326 RepID=A0AAN6P893_9PEZI|nr:hypothetical protein C8A01DRAFT_19487 [Parachaetomium inaequale]
MRTWRYVFYILFPFCGVGLLVTPWIVTLRPQTASAREKLGSIDWLGCFSFVSSATLFLVAVSWGGVQYPWGSTGTLVPLCLGATGLFWTLLYGALFASKPFLRPTLFWNGSSAVAYLCGSIQGLVLRPTPTARDKYRSCLLLLDLRLTLKPFRPKMSAIAVRSPQRTAVLGKLTRGQGEAEGHRGLSSGSARYSMHVDPQPDCS